MGNQQGPIPLKVQIHSAETQTQELFDYQAKKTLSVPYSVQGKSYIIEKDITQEMQIVPEKQLMPGQRALFQIGKNQFNHRQIGLTRLTSDSSQVSEKSQSVWRVIEPQQKHPLSENNIIKLGKIKLRVKKICTQKRFQTKQKQQLAVSEASSVSGVSRVNQCRICFRSSNKGENPLLTNLCHCVGSVNSIHYLCLKDWIESNRSKRIRGNSYCYAYVEPSCEICKAYYPKEVKLFDKTFNLMEFETVQPPYIIFESIQQSQGGPEQSTRYVLSYGEQEGILVGRNVNCTFNLRDISVSRTHCKIILEKNVFFLSDQNSKYGTLIAIQQQTQFDCSTGIKLQYDSKLILIEKQKKKLSCCCNDSFPMMIRYQKQLPLYISKSIGPYSRSKRSLAKLSGESYKSRMRLMANEGQQVIDESNESEFYSQNGVGNGLLANTTLNMRNMVYSETNHYEANSLHSAGSVAYSEH